MHRLKLASLLAAYVVAGVVCPCLGAAQATPMDAHAPGDAQHSHHLGSPEVCHGVSTADTCNPASIPDDQAPVPDIRFSDIGDSVEAGCLHTSETLTVLEKPSGPAPPAPAADLRAESPCQRGDCLRE